MAESIIGMEDLDDSEIMNDVAHEKLLKSLFALDGKKQHRNVVRGLPVASGSFDLGVHAKQDNSKIQLGDLIIKPKNVTKHLKSPVNSLEVDKARRQIARDSVAAEMKKWNPVVKDFRAAPQSTYSKRPYGIKMYEAIQPKPFIPWTPLEKELYEALGRSEDILKPDQELTAAEAKALKAMSVKEAKARRAELMKHHELLSRMERKAKRQKKIKSKRYRKILRKEKVAAEKKELEQLQKTDPQAFLEKLEQMEKARMEERLTLKHKGGSRFSRMHKTYSKFDDKTRQAVQDMLQKSRELTQKRQDAGSNDEDDDDDENSDVNVNNKSATEKMDEDSDGEIEDDEMQKANVKVKQLEFLTSMNKKSGGWLDRPKSTYIYNQSRLCDEVVAQTPGSVMSLTDSAGHKNFSKKRNDDTGIVAILQRETESVEVLTTEVGPTKLEVRDYDISKKSRKPKVEKASIKLLKSSQESGLSQKASDFHLEDGDEEEDISTAINTLKNLGKRGVMSNEHTMTDEPKQKKRKHNKRKKKGEDNMSKETESEFKEKLVNEVVLQTPFEKEEGGSDVLEEESDSDNGMKVTMEELFQDEDVVEQFAKERADAEKRNHPKIQDTKLPGWGSWAGPDYKQRKENERQKQKTAIKAKQQQNQQQKVKQPNVWFNPNRNDSIRKLQPKIVPFPYTSVQQYEASLRQPVSRGFVRETAFKLLTKPEIVTKLGHIIKPLDKEDYFEKKDIDFDGHEDAFDGGKIYGWSSQGGQRPQRRSIR